MKNNERLIVILFSSAFEDENNVSLNGKKVHLNILQSALEEVFEYKFHLFGIKNYENNLRLAEKIYFNDGYRAYIRPFDTPKQRFLAHEILNVTNFHFEINRSVTVTFLYKLNSWRNLYKTYYHKDY